MEMWRRARSGWEAKQAGGPAAAPSGRAAWGLLALLAATVLPAGPTFGEDAELDGATAPIRIRDAVARPSGGSPAAGIFLTIENTGAEPDRLLGVESPAAALVQLHETVHDGDMVRMRHRPEGYAIPAQGTVKLAHGGKHIMLTALVKPLEAGDVVPLVLRFERAGAIQVSVPVQPHEH